MSAITWDAVGDRLYETGTDKGVLYIPDSGGAYSNGVGWNGLVSVSETPSGAESNKQYADNGVYLNLISAEEFGGTVEAFTYPDEFAQFDGQATPTDGVSVGQQRRGSFGLSFRTLLGNDLEGTDYGYKLHLVYGCQATPSEKAYATVNDSPEAVTLSWELTTTPVPAGAGLRPTAQLVIDSTKVDATALSTLEDLLHGTVSTDPQLPSPATVIALFAGTVTEVTPTQPTYNTGTDTLTIPSITGVMYYVNDVLAPADDYVLTEDAFVRAVPAEGYVFPSGIDVDWLIDWDAV